MVISQYEARKTLKREVIVELLPYNPTNDPHYSVDEHKEKIKAWADSEGNSSFNLWLDSRTKDLLAVTDSSREAMWPYTCPQTGLQVLVNIRVRTPIGGNPDWDL